MLFGVIMYYHWVVMLYTFLSSRVMTLPFQDLDSLVLNTDYRIAIIPDSAEGK